VTPTEALRIVREETYEYACEDHVWKEAIYELEMAVQAADAAADALTKLSMYGARRFATELAKRNELVAYRTAPIPSNEQDGRRFFGLDRSKPVQRETGADFQEYMLDPEERALIDARRASSGRP
jgi:hypothetical protein